MRIQKLTVHGYSENSADERRVTLSPSQIVSVIAEVEDVTINNRSLRNVCVVFLDGGSMDIILNHGDLELLESAIGNFYTE